MGFMDELKRLARPYEDEDEEEFEDDFDRSRAPRMDRTGGRYGPGSGRPPTQTRRTASPDEERAPQQ